MEMMSVEYKSQLCPTTSPRNRKVSGAFCMGKVLEFSVSYREDLYYNKLEKISRRTEK